MYLTFLFVLHEAVQGMLQHLGILPTNTSYNNLHIQLGTELPTTIQATRCFPFPAAIWASEFLSTSGYFLLTTHILAVQPPNPRLRSS